MKSKQIFFKIGRIPPKTSVQLDPNPLDIDHTHQEPDYLSEKEVKNALISKTKTNRIGMMHRQTSNSWYYYWY